MELIKSISHNQQDILNDIIKLHNEGQPFQLDLTYSKGVFYKGDRVPQPIYKVDISPQTPDTIQLDTYLATVNNGSLKSIVIDPPFVISKGGSLTNNITTSNIISKRFSYYENITQLRDNWLWFLGLAHLLLDQGGILVFKCQNTVSSGKQYMNCPWLIKTAQDIGFYVKDEFVLLAKHRLPGKTVTQRHARKYHSFFYVFKKL